MGPCPRAPTVDPKNSGYGGRGFLVPRAGLRMAGAVPNEELHLVRLSSISHELLWTKFWSRPSRLNWRNPFRCRYMCVCVWHVCLHVHAFHEWMYVFLCSCGCGCGCMHVRTSIYLLSFPFVRNSMLHLESFTINKNLEFGIPNSIHTECSASMMRIHMMRQKPPGPIPPKAKCCFSWPLTTH